MSTSFLASGAPQVISQNKRLSATCWTGSASYLSPVTDGKQSTFLCYNQSGSSDPHYEIHSQEKESVYSTCRVADLESPLSCLIYYVYKILLDSWFLFSSCSVSLIKNSHCSRMSLVMSFAKGLDGCSPNRLQCEAPNSCPFKTKSTKSILFPCFYKLPWDNV